MDLLGTTSRAHRGACSLGTDRTRCRELVRNGRRGGRRVPGWGTGMSGGWLGTQTRWRAAQGTRVLSRASRWDAGCPGAGASGSCLGFPSREGSGGARLGARRGVPHPVLRCRPGRSPHDRCPSVTCRPASHWLPLGSGTNLGQNKSKVRAGQTAGKDGTGALAWSQGARGGRSLWTQLPISSLGPDSAGGSPTPGPWGCRRTEGQRLVPGRRASPRTCPLTVVSLAP